MGEQLKWKWNAIVGIVRGKTVVYRAHIDVGTVVLDNPRGAVVVDVFIENADPAIRAERGA